MRSYVDGMIAFQHDRNYHSTIPITQRVQATFGEGGGSQVRAKSERLGAILVEQARQMRIVSER